GGGDLGLPPAQAELPPLGGSRGPSRADRRDLDRDRGAAGGAVPLPPRGRAGAPGAGAALGGARVVMLSRVSFLLAEPAAAHWSPSLPTSAPSRADPAIHLRC